MRIVPRLALSALLAVLILTSCSSPPKDRADETDAAGRRLTDADKTARVNELFQECRPPGSGNRSGGTRQAPDIDAVEAVRRAGQGDGGNGENGGDVLLVDARPETERRVSTLPGALAGDVFQAGLRSGDGRYRGRTVIVYCTIGCRSISLADEAAASGMDAYNLRGGILAWAFAGGTIRDANGETRRVHVYGARWNYLPKGWTPVW